MSNQKKTFDWSIAPKDAQFLSSGYLRKQTSLEEEYYYHNGIWYKGNYQCIKKHKTFPDFQERPKKIKNLNTLTSTDILNSVLLIQKERAKEYEQAGGERSFDRIAEIFNAYTHKGLAPSDIALIFTILKYVRSEHTTEVHTDSYIDKVSYDSLWAELRIKEKTEALDK